MKTINIIKSAIIVTLLFYNCRIDDDDIVRHDPNNKHPIANAGYDQTIFLPTDSIFLDGTSSIDNDGTITNYWWSKIDGPASSGIISPSSARTQVKNLVEGVYLFGLTVTDNGGLKAEDIVRIHVTPLLSGCNEGPYPFINVSITEIGYLSDARAPAVAAAGSKIVFAGGANRTTCSGGWCNTFPSSDIDIYDVNSHTWNSTQLSQARQGMGAVSCGNKLFFAGGSNYELYFINGIVYDNVDIYDVSADVWTVAHLSLPRSYVTAAVLANKVFFAGGTENGMTGSTRVDIYDVPTNSWSIGELSVPRYSIDAVVDDNKIYFIGGETWDDYVGYWGDVSRIIDIYDASTNSWSTSTLEEPYYAVRDVMVGNTNYWIYYGGTNQVKIKNMSTGVVTEGCAPNSEAYSINNDIIFPYSSDVFVAVIIYNTVTGQWSAGLLNQNLSASSAKISVDNTVYVGGGSFEKNAYTNYTNKVYALNW